MAPQPETEHWPAWTKPVIWICTMRLSFQDSKPVWYLQVTTCLTPTKVEAPTKKWSQHCLQKASKPQVLQGSSASSGAGSPRLSQILGAPAAAKGIGRLLATSHGRSITESMVVQRNLKQRHTKTPRRRLCATCGRIWVLLAWGFLCCRLNFSLPSIFWVLRSCWIRVAYDKPSILVNTWDWLPKTLRWIASKLDVSKLCAVWAPTNPVSKRLLRILGKFVFQRVQTIIGTTKPPVKIHVNHMWITTFMVSIGTVWSSKRYPAPVTALSRCVLLSGHTSFRAAGAGGALASGSNHCGREMIEMCSHVVYIML